MAWNTLSILLKRGTKDGITALNPVLGEGELVFEKDTRRLKVGDGSTPWASLTYLFDRVAADLLYPTKQALTDGLAAKADLVTGKIPKAQLPTLGKGDVGLSAVDNTADIDKPVSTATQAALDQLAGQIGTGGGGGGGGNVLVLSAGAAVPAGTPDGTVIVRLPS